MELPAFLNVQDVGVIVAVTRLGVAADIAGVWLNLQPVPNANIDILAGAQTVVTAHRAITVRFGVEEAVVGRLYARPGAKKNRPRPHNAQTRSSLVRYERHHHKTPRLAYLADFFAAGFVTFFVTAFFAAGFFAARFAACFGIVILLPATLKMTLPQVATGYVAHTRGHSSFNNMPIIHPTAYQPAMYAMKERKASISYSS